MSESYRIKQIVPALNYRAVFRDKTGVSVQDVAVWALVEFDDGNQAVYAMTAGGDGAYLDFPHNDKCFVTCLHKSDLILEDWK